MIGKEELRLPHHLISLSVKSSNEYGWKKKDFLDVIEAARSVPMAIIGGQIQYIISDGTCELYWLSYDSAERESNEDWISYCNRTAHEVSNKFFQLLNTDIQKEAVNAFPDILANNGKPIDNLDNYQVFILYFDDKETDSFLKN